jgi:pyruvate/2-oxoglutarate dehydrogenase complex dihydrolipoamide dehydrogenase (E3) component
LEATLPDGTTRQLRGTNVIIDTGTRAALEPIAGLTEAQPLTHVEALELDQIPEHLLVLGGGYVGLELELFQAMRRFGSKVSIIERNDRLVHHEDVTDALRSLFAGFGRSGM